MGEADAAGRQRPTVQSVSPSRPEQVPAPTAQRERQARRQPGPQPPCGRTCTGPFREPGRSSAEPLVHCGDVHRVSVAKKAAARLKTPRPPAACGSPAAVPPVPRARRCSGRRVRPRRPRPASPSPTPRSRSGRSPWRPDRPNGPPSTQLDDLGFELRGERAPRAQLLLPHALHDEHHPSGAGAPDLRCPSKRIKPSSETKDRPRYITLLIQPF
ncbi:hypothetical protein OV450_8240 [Actinobacteria bacterium OV450]|nr:hypothetical protein OV450_8240 [Actinobacteria bacterium OV450]